MILPPVVIILFPFPKTILLKLLNFPERLAVKLFVLPNILLFITFTAFMVKLFPPTNLLLFRKSPVKLSTISPLFSISVFTARDSAVIFKRLFPI